MAEVHERRETLASFGKVRQIACGPCCKMQLRVSFACCHITNIENVKGLIDSKTESRVHLQSYNYELQ